MSPTKTGPGGCYRFDRLFRGVGRVQVSSGVKKLTAFHRRDGLLTKLYEQGRLDLLLALKERRITIAELVNADRQDRLPQVAADLVADRPLWATAKATLARMTCDPATRRNYLTSWTALEASGLLPTDAKVSSLLRVNWRGLEGIWGRSPAHWNHLRRAVSRTLTVLLDSKVHPFRVAVLKDFPTRHEIDREPDFTPAAFWKVVGMIREDMRPFYVALAALGCRGGELMQMTREDLMPLTSSVRIRHKTKNRTSYRVLPVAPTLYAWIDRAVPVPLRREWYREKWYAACDEAQVARVRLHDLRHCHGQWAIRGGVPEVVVQRYLGHATAHMTRKYAAQLAQHSDASAIAKALGVPQAVPQVRKRKRHA